MFDRLCPWCGKAIHYVTQKGRDVANIRRAPCNECKKSKFQTQNLRKPASRILHASPGFGWSGWYQGWFFRSLLELAYVRNYLEKEKLVWESGEQKKYAIHYLDSRGWNRFYFPDFVVDNNRLVECKPTNLWKEGRNLAKWDAARDYCKQRGWTFEVVDPGSLPMHELKVLVANGDIKLTSKWNRRFQKLK